MRERIEVALAMVDATDAQIAPLERDLRQLARRQTGRRASLSASRWANPAFAERVYLILSLVAKSALAWQVYAGALAGG
jgi:hypothetical protein